MNHLIVYTLPCQEKWQWLLFSWTISRLVHTHSLWHCFNWSMQSHFLKKKNKVLLQNIFFSTTWRFSMELKSGLCSRESMCENADLCFLEPICYHLCPMILGNVTATLQSVALQRKKNQLMAKLDVSVYQWNQLSFIYLLLGISYNCTEIYTTNLWLLSHHISISCWLQSPVITDNCKQLCNQFLENWFLIFTPSTVSIQRTEVHTQYSNSRNIVKWPSWSLSNSTVMEKDISSSLQCW